MDEDFQNLPIDIQIGKLVDWLVSRQHSTKEWAEISRNVREQINSAIQDMPEHPDITRLLSGTYINYFHCLRIIEILKETEADSKNILGWYTSQRMKDWQAVLKLYEKNGVGLAEAGQLLHRYVTYELPSIKGHVARCLQIQQECDKKVADIHKAATHHQTAYSKQCKLLAISGHNVRKELFGLLAELPIELDIIGKRFADLKEVADFYLNFVCFTSQGKFQESVSTLRYICDHGNVTTYEYRHGEPPLSVEDPIDAMIREEEVKANVAIDVEGIDFGETYDGGIDFGDGEQSPAEIDIGDDGGIDFGNDNQESIDWTASELNAAGITIEETGMSGGIARGTEALSLLLNPNTRDAVLDDLCEIEGFLMQRLAEMTETQDSKVVLNLWDDAPKSLQMVSGKIMQSQLTMVQDILHSLQSPKLAQLFLISASPRYVDRLTQRLQEQNRRCALPEDVLQEVQNRRGAAVKQQKALLSQAEKIKAAARMLCIQLQDAISSKYNGRPVNITGVMHTLAA